MLELLGIIKLVIYVYGVYGGYFYYYLRSEYFIQKGVVRDERRVKIGGKERALMILFESLDLVVFLVNIIFDFLSYIN